VPCRLTDAHLAHHYMETIKRAESSSWCPSVLSNGHVPGKSVMVTLVREVADTVDLVSRTIQNARQIAAAFKDARGYLTKRYPGANADLAGLLTEMRLTLVGLAKVSDVITGFQFTVSGAGRDLEPARFNNLVIERKHLLSELRNSISSLKGSSGKMNDYATALTEHSGRPA